MKHYRKFTFNLLEQEAQSLEFMSANSSMPRTMASIVREAIIVEQFLHDALSQRDRLVLVHRQNPHLQQEVVFPLITGLTQDQI